MNNTRFLELDFYRTSYKSVKAHQYDKNTRYIEVTCINDADVYPLNPAAMACRLKLTTPDGRHMWKDEEIQPNGTVLITLEESMLLAAGICKAELNVYGLDTQQLLSTMPFDLIVIGSVYDNSIIESTDEFSALNNLLFAAHGLFETLKEHISNFANPHKVDKAQVGLGNVPNVTTNDQTPTYTEAASLTKLISGEKLSVAFGKISKAVTDLISHIANKSNPHGVTKAQVGLGNVDDTSDMDKPISTAQQAALNAKAPIASPTLTGTPKAPTATAGTNTTQIATTAFVQSAVSNHNTSSSAHSDIRDLISGLTARLNALADSDDTTLDQLSEIVAYIKSNRNLIETVMTNKVNVSDIVDNLSSTATNKPLSANQGKVLSGLISALTAVVENKAEKSHASTATTYGVSTASNYGHAMASSTTPKAPGTAAVGTETAKFARGDHVHPLQTSVSGSSGSCTGNATTATALTSSAGSATQPVYFSGGKPVACTYTLGKSVPSNAVFTDTVYSLPLATSSVRGGVKIGYSANGKNYPVQLSSEKMYVNVPWTDTDYKAAGGTVNGDVNAGGKARMWTDNEGGNFQLVSPDGTLWEIDAVDNNLRIFTYANSVRYGITIDKYGRLQFPNGVYSPKDTESIRFIGELNVNHAGMGLTTAGDFLVNNRLGDIYIRVKLGGAGVGIQDVNGAFKPVVASSFIVGSSRRYKDNILPMAEDRARRILDVEVATYDYKDGIMSPDAQYDRSGVIAEDTAGIIPEVVSYKEIDGERVPDSVDYSKFVPYLIRMVQLQQAQMDAMQDEINILRYDIDILKG